MPDELELLRQFRADTPGPDDAAWERARTAIADAGAPQAAGTSPAVRHDIRPARRYAWQLTRRRAWIIAAVAAAVAAGSVVVVARQPPTLSGPLTTAWQSARPLPAQGHSVQAPAGAWRLASYLVARGWQQNTAGPRPGLITCPTAATCYVEGDTATSPSGPADMNSLYLSTDGTQTWRVLPVPANVTFTSPLACATAKECGAGALYGGHQPVYLSTTTGGHSWSARPLPAGIGPVAELTCVSASRCQGLAAPPGKTLDPNLTPVPQTFMVTTLDSGRSWTTQSFPAGDEILSVRCPTTEECVAAGLTGRYQEAAIVLMSRNGGATWRRGTLDRSQTLSGDPDVTCVDASHCRMLGYILPPGNVASAASQYSVYDYSDDGGLTWTAVTFPKTIPAPRLDALACPTAQICYAAGGDLIPQGPNEQSAVVAVTHDAGRTWQRISFEMPAKVPSGMQADSFMEIGQIDCPQENACVALGVSDQGSTSTPVYTNHG
jgi:photosystem II stability/assembly factor-like uncharacterized protein